MSLPKGLELVKERTIMGLIGWVRSDVEAQKQIVTVFATAFVVIIVEVMIFLYGVVPATKQSVHLALSPRRGADSLDRRAWADPGTALGRGMLCTLQQLEMRDTRERNRRVMVIAAMIIFLPFLIVLLMFAISAPLRNSSLRYVAIDVLLGVVLLVAFQGTFYMLGMNWTYTPVQKVNSLVVQTYRDQARSDGDEVRANADYSAAIGLDPAA